MSIHTLGITIALAVAFVPSSAAQHEAHQPVAPATSGDMAKCAQVQPVVQNIIAAAASRIESARLSNSAADMRAAIENLEGVLRDIRLQLAPCASAAAPHAGHGLPGTQPPTEAVSPVAKSPAPVADPHAGHQTSTRQPAASAKPKPTAPKTAPAAADPHAAHGKPAKPRPAAKPATPSPSVPHTHQVPAEQPAKPAGKQMDPVTGLMVDPATAPKTTYQGQTYYFSSEQSRKEF
ncbi:MAG: hypothetical protein LC753_07360, partial [Acidobacteria bacterium]|nr:hypothetical protein [Acidobacteriota bacterium]